MQFSNLGKFAAVSALGLLAGLALAPALAEKSTSRTETVEIRKVIHDGPGKPGDPEAMMKNCPGQTIDVSAENGPGGDRKEVAKIKLCLKAGTRAEAAAQLEEVVADLDKRDEMDSGIKAQLKAKLTTKIAELRAAN